MFKANTQALYKLVGILDVDRGTEANIAAACDAAKALRNRVLREMKKCIEAVKRMETYGDPIGEPDDDEGFGGGQDDLEDEEYFAEMFGDEEGAQAAKKKRRERHRRYDPRDDDTTFLLARPEYLALGDMNIMENVVLKTLLKFGPHHPETLLPQLMKLIAALTMPVPPGSLNQTKQKDTLSNFKRVLATENFMSIVVAAIAPLAGKRRDAVLPREDAVLIEVALNVFTNLLKSHQELTETVVGVMCRTHAVELLFVIMNQNHQKTLQVEASNRLVEERMAEVEATQQQQLFQEDLAAADGHPVVADIDNGDVEVAPPVVDDTLAPQQLAAVTPATPAQRPMSDVGSESAAKSNSAALSEQKHNAEADALLEELEHFADAVHAAIPKENDGNKQEEQQGQSAKKQPAPQSPVNTKGNDEDNGDADVPLFEGLENLSSANLAKAAAAEAQQQPQKAQTAANLGAASRLETQLIIGTESQYPQQSTFFGDTQLIVDGATQLEETQLMEATPVSTGVAVPVAVEGEDEEPPKPREQETVAEPQAVVVAADVEEKEHAEEDVGNVIDLDELPQAGTIFLGDDGNDDDEDDEEEVDPSVDSDDGVDSEEDDEVTTASKKSGSAAPALVDLEAEESDDGEDEEDDGELQIEGLEKVVQEDEVLARLIAERDDKLRSESVAQINRWNFILLEATMLIFRCAPATNLASSSLVSVASGVDAVHQKLSQALLNSKKETDNWRHLAKVQHGAVASTSVLVKKSTHDGGANAAPRSVLGSVTELMGSERDPIAAAQNQDRKKKGRMLRSHVFNAGSKVSTLPLPAQMQLASQFAEFMQFGFADLSMMMFPLLNKRSDEMLENVREAQLESRVPRSLEEDGPLLTQLDTTQLGDCLNYASVCTIVLRYTREMLQQVVQLHRERAVTEEEAMIYAQKIRDQWQAVGNLMNMQHFLFGFSLLASFRNKEIMKTNDIVIVTDFLAEMLFMLVRLMDGDIATDTFAINSAKTLASSLMYNEEHINMVLALVGSITFRGAPLRKIRSYLMLSHALFLVLEHVSYGGMIALPRRAKNRGGAKTDGHKGDDTAEGAINDDELNDYFEEGQEDIFADGAGEQDGDDDADLEGFIDDEEVQEKAQRKLERKLKREAEAAAIEAEKVAEDRAIEADLLRDDSDEVVPEKRKQDTTDVEAAAISETVPEVPESTAASPTVEEIIRDDDDDDNDIMGDDELLAEEDARYNAPIGEAPPTPPRAENEDERQMISIPRVDPPASYLQAQEEVPSSTTAVAGTLMVDSEHLPSMPEGPIVANTIEDAIQQVDQRHEESVRAESASRAPSSMAGNDAASSVGGESAGVHSMNSSSHSYGGAALSLIDDHDLVMSEGMSARDGSHGAPGDSHSLHEGSMAANRDGSEVGVASLHEGAGGSSLHTSRASHRERDVRVVDFLVRLATPKYVQIFILACKQWRQLDDDGITSLAYFIGRFRGDDTPAGYSLFTIQFLLAFSDILHNAKQKADQGSLPHEMLYNAVDAAVFDFFNPNKESKDLPPPAVESTAKTVQTPLGELAIDPVTGDPIQERGFQFELALRCARSLFTIAPGEYIMLEEHANTDDHLVSSVHIEGTVGDDHRAAGGHAEVARRRARKAPGTTGRKRKARGAGNEEAAADEDEAAIAQALAEMDGEEQGQQHDETQQKKKKGKRGRPKKATKEEDLHSEDSEDEYVPDDFELELIKMRAEEAAALAGTDEIDLDAEVRKHMEAERRRRKEARDAKKVKKSGGAKKDSKRKRRDSDDEDEDEVARKERKAKRKEEKRLKKEEKKRKKAERRRLLQGDDGSATQNLDDGAGESSASDAEEDAMAAYREVEDAGIEELAKQQQIEAPVHLEGESVPNTASLLDGGADE